MAVELVHVYRGDKIESIHKGDVVGVDIEGNVLFEYGSKDKHTYWRSSAKPFQIIPFIEAGGMNAFNITTKELALMTSSHGGEKEHVSVLDGLLNKIGKSIDDLDCGASKPMYNEAYFELLKENKEYTAANNACSGKHTGMLGLGVLKDINLDNYINKDHDIQKIMLNIVSEITELDKKNIDIAIDGCGVPVFGFPIYNMALAFTKLSTQYNDIYNESLKLIADAMTKEPYYVAGTSRLDTILMEETNGKVLAKLGAESVYCMTVINEGVGIALKTEDGSYRALNSIVPSLLFKHNYITEDEFNRINERLPLEVKNHRNEIVGKLVSVL